MVESTPSKPYGCDGLLLSGLVEIESNMKVRRQECSMFLGPDESAMTLTNFVRLGCLESLYPDTPITQACQKNFSIFVPLESAFQGHPRFSTLSQNAIARRRRKFDINAPIMKDVNTPSPFVEQFDDPEAKKFSKPDHIYMDNWVFGMGCCCLQITLQASHLKEAKILYDQLIPWTPIMIAVGAAVPAFRGYLSDRDSRWSVISESTDDRTEEEMKPLKSGVGTVKSRIPKPRYDSVSSYLSDRGQEFNDIPLVFEDRHYELMVRNNVDPAVARHIAHMFIRDPLVVYREKLDQTETETDHLENILTSNWQTLRFKPPPSADSPIGWRVEFRPIDVQLTDFDNAAYVVFIILLTRVILAYKLDFLMPISLVDANIAEAQKRDAIIEKKFWFKNTIMPRSNPNNKPLCAKLENNRSSNSRNANPASMNCCQNIRRPTSARRSPQPSTMQASGHRTASPTMASVKTSIATSGLSRMTCNEILNGSERFVGIIPIIHHYVDSFNDTTNTQMIDKIKSYLRVIEDRAALRTKTVARLIRDYVMSHPKYAHDSKVTDEINYDLMVLLDKIGKGEASSNA